MKKLLVAGIVITVVTNAFRKITPSRAMSSAGGVLPLRELSWCSSCALYERRGSYHFPRKGDLQGVARGFHPCEVDERSRVVVRGDVRVESGRGSPRGEGARVVRKSPMWSADPSMTGLGPRFGRSASIAGGWP